MKQPSIKMESSWTATRLTNGWLLFDTTGYCLGLFRQKKGKLINTNRRIHDDLAQMSPK